MRRLLRIFWAKVRIFVRILVKMDGVEVCAYGLDGRLRWIALAKSDVFELIQKQGVIGEYTIVFHSDKVIEVFYDEDTGQHSRSPAGSGGRPA
jgi:hypothetical protein